MELSEPRYATKGKNEGDDRRWEGGGGQHLTEMLWGFSQRPQKPPAARFESRRS